MSCACVCVCVFYSSRLAGVQMTPHCSQPEVAAQLECRGTSSRWISCVAPTFSWPASKCIMIVEIIISRCSRIGSSIIAVMHFYLQGFFLPPALCSIQKKLMKSLFFFHVEPLCMFCVFLCVRFANLCVFSLFRLVGFFLRLCSRSAFKTLFGFNSLSSPDS